MTGDVIFTSNGMSGPAIYDLSKTIGQNLSDEIKLHIDFFLTTEFSGEERHVRRLKKLSEIV